LSAQFSGDGFSDMRFEVAAVSPQAFAQWIDETRAHGGSLGAPEYAELTRPTRKDAPRTFAAVSPKLFDAILATPGAAPREISK
jgi:cytochrome o ubiquinol oxidase subunit 2